MTTLPQMMLLGHKLQDTALCFGDFGETGVEGILGMDILRHFKLTVDFPNGILDIE